MQFRHLSNEELLVSLSSLVGDERRLLARVIAHLVEVEDRRLHLDLASSSMFDFCTRRLGFSEGEAFRRIAAARLVRRFPQVLAAIEEGRLHLSTLVLLREHLTEANVDELVGATAGKSKRDVQELLACRFPRPDVGSSIRKLPAMGRPGDAFGGPIATSTPLDALLSPKQPLLSDGPPSALERLEGPAPLPAPAPAPAPTRGALSSVADPPAEESAPGLAPAPHATARPATMTREPVIPLSEGRYKLQLTMSASLREKLEHARELLRHANPSGDLAVVVERAVGLLIEKLEKAKHGKLASAEHLQRPRRSADAATRHVPRGTRREVFLRDGMQCSFVGDDGGRCPARAFLELDHIHPRARGGDSTTANLRVLCRGHNRHAAEATFGRAHVQRRISERQSATDTRAIATDRTAISTDRSAILTDGSAISADDTAISTDRTAISTDRSAVFTRTTDTTDPVLGPPLTSLRAGPPSSAQPPRPR